MESLYPSLYLHAPPPLPLFPRAPLQKLFSREELKSHDGVTQPSLYLAILGQVFDVTKGHQHYGEGGRGRGGGGGGADGGRSHRTYVCGRWRGGPGGSERNYRDGVLPHHHQPDLIQVEIIFSQMPGADV